MVVLLDFDPGEVHIQTIHAPGNSCRDKLDAGFVVVNLANGLDFLEEFPSNDRLRFQAGVLISVALFRREH